MVILSLRNRQNRECVDEDLRANKKVFERLQKQVSLMPQSEMPPNDKIQDIAFQFNKDIENVKNALNDGLTAMTSADAIEREFADFSKVSLSWNKLVARINPYIKGQQTDPDFQAATAGDYNYIRQKLRDDLLQFFTNGKQQITAFKREVANRGGVATVQNEASIDNIIEQLGTGFYKNVRYGAEQRTSLVNQRLPPNVLAAAQAAQQPPQPPPQPPQPPAQPPQPPAQPPQPPAQPPQPPQPQPQPRPAQLPLDAQIGGVFNEVFDNMVNPYQPEDEATPQEIIQRRQQLSDIHQRITDTINAFESTGQDITDPRLDIDSVIDSFSDDIRDDLNRFYNLGDDEDRIDQFLAALLDEFTDYRFQRGQFALPQPPQQQQQQQPPRMFPQFQELGEEEEDFLAEYEADNDLLLNQLNAERASQDIEADMFESVPEAAQGQITDQARREKAREIENLIREYISQRPQQRQARQEESPAQKQRGRPKDLQRQIAIEQAALRIGVKDILTGYSRMDKAQKGQVRFAVELLADELGLTPSALKRNLNQMTGFGRSMKGGFLGSILALGALAPSSNTLDTLKNLGKQVISSIRGGERKASSRDVPLRLNNDFTGTSVVPNTLAELKNRLRIAKDGDYVGDSTGAIVRNLQNRGVLGSGRRRPLRMEGEGVAEVLASIKDMSQSALENILFPAFNALAAALRRGVQVGKQIPPAVQRILETSRGVYRREDVQTVLQYLKNHPDVLIPFLPTPYAVGAVVLRLIQSYMNLSSQTGTEERVGREPRFEREEEGFVVGEGSGRCCFNAGMCRGTKAYRFNYGEKSANVRKESVRGRGAVPKGFHIMPDGKLMKDSEHMKGAGNGVNVNIKYSKLPKALQPTEEDLNPQPKPNSSSGGVRRPRMPKESYEGFQDQENDVYTHRGGMREASPLVHSEMLQDKALGLLKGLPRRLGVEDPKYKAPKM
ncbi:hypothetical protein [Dishui Lake virophage 6]|nr:hypothetical protein [Dishui Lake virophage 6]